MSWQDDITTIVFTIITGDGKIWQPKWLNAQKSVEYNSSVFEFVNIEGSLVLRQKRKGLNFDLEFYFDGENAVQTGNDFEFSARNPKPWTIKHPFYGNILCQPVSLKQDNSAYNVSKFSVPVIETISEKYPAPLQIIEDKVSANVAISNEIAVNSLAGSDLNKTDLKSDVSLFDRTYSKIIQTNDELILFKKLVSESLAEIESSTATSLSILRSIQALIEFPALVEQTINARINTFAETISNLFTSIDGSRESFFKYEGLAGLTIGSILLASVTNTNDDYNTRSKIMAIQSRIIAIYNSYLLNLDSLQTDRADSDTSYTPDFDTQNNLNLSVQYAISNLFELAFAAKQEREFVLDKDSNLILLTHRFYGLDADDVNIDKFISINNLSLSEILNIQKGRKIIYYV